MMDRRSLLKIASAVAVAGAVPARRVLAADRVNRLLLVHGRAQQGRNPDAIKAEWLGALDRGAATFGQTLPSDVEVALPFYGDILDRD